MKSYKHIFFDLDRTLWDFDKNSEESISDLFSKHKLELKLQVDFPVFFKEYVIKNHELWAMYRKGKVTKDELRLRRFHHTFQRFNLNDPDFALQFNDEYIKLCSSKSNLIPNTLEVLDYLKPMYKLHIITNGFIEAQELKIKNSGLSAYFENVIVSDGMGFTKPDKRIFYHALDEAKANPEDSIMIGDDYGPDIEGARAVGMDQIFFTKELTKNQEATYVVNDLIEIKKVI